VVLLDEDAIGQTSTKELMFYGLVVMQNTLNILVDLLAQAGMKIQGKPSRR
jgi:hypothetical protein